MTGSIINEWGKVGETRYHFPFFILFSFNSISLSLVASFHSCLGGNGKDEKEVARCFPLRFLSSSTSAE